MNDLTTGTTYTRIMEELYYKTVLIYIGIIAVYISCIRMFVTFGSVDRETKKPMTMQTCLSPCGDFDFSFLF